MITIKELEAEREQIIKDCGPYAQDLDSRAYQIQALKDVLGLIDIRLKQIKRAYSQQSCSKQQYYWVVNEFEELKSRITG